jgi:C4-dicarboxylate-specific signal transduction histidine kinase
MPREQKPSCDWRDLIHANDRQHCQDVYANAFESKQPFKVEYRLRCQDGVFRWIEDSGVPRFSADGEYLGFIGTCIDFTGRRLFEVLRGEMEHTDRLNIAGEMASGLAHELSQPLASANTYLGACLRGMAAERWDTARLHRTVTLAHAQTERAGKIIKHLKELISKKEFERSMLDINSVIRDSIQFLEHDLRQSMILVTLDVSPLPPVRANKIEIEQVLTNLIRNAIDSMYSAQRRELHIVTRAIESGVVLVKVSDTGKGIAAEDMDRVFDAFHTSKKDGLGLGLAICRSLIENYGGKIWVEQKEDEGSEFNFTLSVGADL